MLCLINFLGNSSQQKLRVLAQSRSEQYENTIEQYKKIFMAHLDYACKDCGEKKCPYRDRCEIIRNKIVQENKQKIFNFFEQLKDIYLLWIDSKTKESIKQFEKVLKSFDLLDFNTQLNDSDIFFKGRVTDDFLTRWDMFHIPFNKRHLINNQRYSLTGQPIVYIGRSVVDVVEELELTDIDKLKISSVQLPKSFKVYDLRNNIITQIVKTDYDLFLGGSIDYNINNFYKLILSSICSFPKREDLKNFSFCEEYVLPQLLAQIVKNKKYDGIMYESTKRFNNIEYLKNDSHVNECNESAEDENRKQKKNNEIAINIDLNQEYKENIALFTKYNEKHVYDSALFKKIEISVPISINKIDHIDLQDLKNIQEEINFTKNQDKVTIAETIISTYNRVYASMQYQGVSYSESKVGQLHLYHLYEILHQVLIVEQEVEK